jgi:hypothetical protein
MVFRRLTAPLRRRSRRAVHNYILRGNIDVNAISWMRRVERCTMALWTVRT